MASICPLLCFWWTSGSPMKLTAISLPTPVPGIGTFPLVSSSMKQRVQGASSTPCKWNTKQSGLSLLGEGRSWTGQRGLRDQGLRCPGHAPPQTGGSQPAAGLRLLLSLGPKEKPQHLCWRKQSLGGFCYIVSQVSLLVDKLETRFYFGEEKEMY